MHFLIWLESLPPSEWLRYSLSMFAFPFIIAMHTVGLAWVAGPSMMIDLRTLGFARGMSIPALGRLLPVMVIGFWINLITGVWLAVAYATTALTNPMVYIKLAFVIAAVVILRVQMTRVVRAPGADTALPPMARGLAVASLVCWLMAIATGRLLAYAGLIFG